MSPIRSTTRRAWIAALVALTTAAGHALADATECTVAVAANFRQPLLEIAAEFSAATGHRVKLAAGPTGRLYSQIVAGAPFDALFAADSATPARLVAEGHAVDGSRFTYAIGRLVLWGRDPGRVDRDGEVLASNRFARLAIANPKLAPYGAAAMDVIAHLGLGERLRPTLVTGESVGQAFQFVVTGNAEIGFVALSQVAASDAGDSGSAWEVPQALYRELRQDAVLLAGGRDNEAARALLAWLRTPRAREQIVRFGYRTADDERVGVVRR